MCVSSVLVLLFGVHDLIVCVSTAEEGMLMFDMSHMKYVYKFIVDCFI